MLQQNAAEKVREACDIVVAACGELVQSVAFLRYLI